MEPYPVSTQVPSPQQVEGQHEVGWPAEHTAHQGLCQNDMSFPTGRVFARSEMREKEGARNGIRFAGPGRADEESGLEEGEIRTASAEGTGGALAPPPATADTPQGTAQTTAKIVPPPAAQVTAVEETKAEDRLPPVPFFRTVPAAESQTTPPMAGFYSYSIIGKPWSSPIALEVKTTPMALEKGTRRPEGERDREIPPRPCEREAGEGTGSTPEGSATPAWGGRSLPGVRPLSWSGVTRAGWGWRVRTGPRSRRREGEETSRDPRVPAGFLRGVLPPGKLDMTAHSCRGRSWGRQHIGS